MPLLVFVATFTVSTSSEQLVLQSNQVNTTVTFSEQLFLQSCYCFGTATFSDLSLLLSRYLFFFLEQQLFQGETSTENRQFFRTTTFREDKLVQVRIRYLQKSHFFEAGNSIQHQIFLNSYFFKADFSKEVPFQSSYFSEKLFYGNS